MKIDLSDKTAIVTGSTAGIGFAIAKGLAEAGARVVVNGRNQAGVDATVAALRQAVSGAAVRGVAADLGTAEGCAAMVAAEPVARASSKLLKRSWAVCGLHSSRS
jgi:NAD(P)-dependent dehydrogenase (short-subunit alcohol dehydrogenase family)